MRVRSTLVWLVTLAACSNSTPGTGSNPRPDAPAPPADAASHPDAPAAAATVMTVACPASPAKAISATDNVNAYVPSSVSISVGQVVKFTMPSAHDVVPDASMSDPGLNVDFAQTRCLMFTHPGTFGFHCAPHGFTGTVAVQ
jgi:plastocyanin